MHARIRRHDDEDRQRNDEPGAANEKAEHDRRGRDEQQRPPCELGIGSPFCTNARTSEMTPISARSRSQNRREIGRSHFDRRAHRHLAAEQIATEPIAT
jgi:hypothetical protein